MRALIDPNVYKIIVTAAQELSIRRDEPLKPLFEMLNEKYDYGQIKLALAVWEEEQGN